MQVREVGQNYKTDLRFNVQALLALQEATEAFLVTMFTCANMAAIHANRQTIMPRDIHLVQRLWQEISGDYCPTRQRHS